MMELNSVQILAQENGGFRSPDQNSRKSKITQKNNELTQRTIMTNISSDQKNNVKVVIRVRPQNEREKANGGQKSCIVVESEEKIVLDRGIEQKMFTFDYVADENIRQEEIFLKMAKPIADSCLQGYNGSIFAYGQTGSGKTFTIQGPTITSSTGEEQIISALNSNESLLEARGLMQRSFEHIFASIEHEKSEAEKNGSEVKYLIKSSYLEIYNEQILDLLDPSHSNLHIREDIKTGVYVDGLVEEPVSSVKDMIALITRGSRNRHVGSTNMNKESSRSHSVLTTQIESKCMTASGVWQMKSSCFHIIDLAGSERSKQTNAEGQRLKEAGMINKSLSALGIVINSLVEISEGRTRHVHYRDSKLTFLLRDSLGGNSKTVIIANITQAANSVNETLSTLKFAQRAKLIKNKAVINEESSGTIALLKTEIIRLKKEIAEISSLNVQAQQKFQNMGETESVICALCRAEQTTQNDQDGFQDEMLLEQTSRSRHGSIAITTDSKMFQQRVVYLENLLAANLDNLTSSQKHFETEQTKKSQSIKWFQQAVEKLEKESKRDKMIIKFRDQRIQKLEQALANQNPAKCKTCETNQEQIENLIQERDSFKDQCDKQSHALSAKLFAENAELQRAKELLESELKQTPESLTSQIRSLNELNDSLSQYLKDHCDQKINERELDSSKVNLQTQLEQLQEQLAQTVFNSELATQSLRSDHQLELQALQEKLTQLHQKHLAEKTQIQTDSNNRIEQIKVQLQSMSEGTESEFTKYRIQALEKQNELQSQIEEKDKLIQQKDDALADNDLTARQLRDSIQKSTLSHQTMVEELNHKLLQQQQVLQFEREAHQTKYKSQRDEFNKELQSLQKELLIEQSQGDTLREQETEQLNKIAQLEAANEEIQKQLTAELETIQELHEQVRSIQANLQAVTKEHAAKLQLAQQQENQWKEHTQFMQKKAAQIETDLRNDLIDLEKVHNEKIQEQARLIKALEAELTESKKMFQDGEQNLKYKQSELADAIESFNQLKSHSVSQDFEQQQYQTQIKQLQNMNHEISGHLLKRNQDLHQANDELEQFKTKLHDLTQAIKRLESSNQSLEESLNEKSQKMSQLNQLNQDLQAKYQTVQLETKQKFKDQEELHIKSRQAITQDFEQQIETLRQKLSETDQELEKQKTTFGSQKTELDLQRQKILNQLKQTELDNLQLQNQNLTLRQSSDQTRQNYTTKLEQIETTVRKTLEIEIEAVKQQAYLQLQEQLIQKEQEVRVVMLRDSQRTLNEMQSQHEIETKQIRKRFEQKQRELLVSMLEKIKNMKNEYMQFRKEIYRKLKWESFAPSQQDLNNFIQNFQLSRTEKEGKHVWEVQSLKALHQKALTAQQATLQSLKDEIADLNEQLVEYKGLTAQLQAEKQQNLKLTIKLQDQLEVTTFALGETKRNLSENTTQLCEQQASALSEKESQIQALQTELDTVRNELIDRATDLTKATSRCQDLQAQLKQSKENITNLLNKESTMMDTVQSKISSLMTEQEKWQQKVQTQRQEINDLRKENETLSSKYEQSVHQSQELNRIKNLDLENRQMTDRQRLSEIESLRAEIQQQQLTISKREVEIKEIVRTLKKVSDEKKQLETEYDQLRQQNDVSAGHTNLQQKIQHHQKIKEENNKLREENYNLKEEIRRKCEMIGQNQPQVQNRQPSEDLERAKREILKMSVNFDKIIQMLTSLPGTTQYLQQMPQLFDKLKNASGTASSLQQAAFNFQQKADVAAELIHQVYRHLKTLIQTHNESQSQSSSNSGNLAIQSQQKSNIQNPQKQNESVNTGVLYLNQNRTQNQVSQQVSQKNNSQTVPVDHFKVATRPPTTPNNQMPQSQFFEQENKINQASAFLNNMQQRNQIQRK